MRKADVDYILSRMLQSHDNVSDLNFTVAKPPQVEASGELTSVTVDARLEKLTPFQTETLALHLMQCDRRLSQLLISQGSCDCSYALIGKARFRVNVFQQRNSYSIVLRKLSTEILTIDDLNLPPIFHQMAQEKNGLILVTGATGSGKSTTLAALIDEMNQEKAIHIVTLEDPIEFVHPHKKATINQRELASDFDTFANGLRAALRQAPKVILVGEMRDRETVEIALSAAETGHLVLSTLHTIDAGQTITRILGMFDKDEEKLMRIRLANTLRWIVSQRLLPKIGGERIAALEIMGTNLRVKESVLNGESEGKTFYEIIEASEPFGMQTFDQSILKLFQAGAISEDTALAYASHKSVTRRGIDDFKKQRGITTTDIAELALDREYGKTTHTKALW
ncbi:MAG TPA: PilT/PilU family type 4a pilus ATPase [Candidatus Tectomicrobia bacterium]|nr:PilT/PilU family type 4a pilus ATPase [Candidatus Tectomicrobia bacterium]